MRLLTVLGTRPEAVKLAPVLLALGKHREITSILCDSGQHRDLSRPVLDFFGLVPDHDLGLMVPGQALGDLYSRCIAAVDALIVRERPDRLIVQGDTVTAFAAATAAYLRGVPVAHVEAGLRSHSMDHPWPEEGNRRMIDTVSDLLFAPTVGAAGNLVAERACGRVLITGNSAIDALEAALARLDARPGLRERIDATLPRHHPSRSLILLTMHRRENQGPGIEGVCEAARIIAQSGMAQIMIPLHPNPQVRAPILARLTGCAHIHLMPPLGLPAMVRAMEKADLILTDSGGLQEEAPSLGKPLLVLREETERPEGVATGVARLVGTDPAAIVAATGETLTRLAAAPVMPIPPSPYGDGRASERIVDALLGLPVQPFLEPPLAPTLPMLMPVTVAAE